MSKGLKEGESYVQYRERMLNSVSSSFCAAKWLNATIWLNSGKTASCHHPPQHDIDLEEIKKNPSAIHNTAQKKEARRQMQTGQRPAECEYCWKIEDLGPERVSDRVFKSFIFEDKEIQKIAKLPWEQNIYLKTLELAFDRICNFACMYCNPSFSTKWVQDIKSNGPYLMLGTDNRKHFETDHPWADPFKDSNPYVEAFWKWWPELSQHLEILRITGGEPLMSPHFWRILDHFDSGKDNHIKLFFNSNLGSKQELIAKLIEKAQHIPHLEIFSSNEAYGPYAEYIRDGMNWELWCQNMTTLMGSGRVNRMHVMMTVNGLCLFSIVDFLEKMLEWKAIYGFENPTFNVNILRHPNFQSCLVIPEKFRFAARDRLKSWIDKNRNNKLLLEFEIESLDRLVIYLEEVESPSEGAFPISELQGDLKRFLVQYDQRRGKDYRKVFPVEFVEWLESI